MENKEDIVNKIVEEIRAKEEPPYREGAWEHFHDKYLAEPKALFSPLWAAAALLIVGGFSGIWFLSKNVDDSKQNNVAVVTEEVDVATGNATPSPEKSTSVTTDGRDEADNLVSQLDGQNALPKIHHPANTITEGQLPTMKAINSVRFDLSQSEAVKLSHVELLPNKVATLGDIDIRVLQSPNLENFVLAEDAQLMTLQGKEVDGENKEFSFSDKFTLGLVVSPSRTDQKLNFGGGLMVSYNISKRISVRTGASFHQYEVGVLRDPINPVQNEVAKSADVPLQSESYALSKASMDRIPLIPNVNAVSGSVQTIDIPIEAKVDVFKGVYATAGVSYAAVINQKRFAHYIENVNSNPYAQGLPSNEKEQEAAVQSVTRKTESATNNVNTNGFGGFVNMSVGKEINVNKKVSLSLEPYIKLPVGNFKHADMNYRNGGIRIITNF